VIERRRLAVNLLQQKKHTAQQKSVRLRRSLIMQAKPAYQLRVKRRENRARLRSDVKGTNLNGQSDKAANSARVVIPARDSLYCFTSCSTNGSDLDQQLDGFTVNTTTFVVDDITCTARTVNCTSIRNNNSADNSSDRSILPFPQHQA